MLDSGENQLIVLVPPLYPENMDNSSSKTLVANLNGICIAIDLYAGRGNDLILFAEGDNRLSSNTATSLALMLKELDIGNMVDILRRNHAFWANMEIDDVEKDLFGREALEFPVWIIVGQHEYITKVLHSIPIEVTQDYMQKIEYVMKMNIPHVIRGISRERLIETLRKTSISPSTERRH